MKEKEDENFIEELVFDEDGNEVQEDIVEELTEEEKEIFGGNTKYGGEKHIIRTLRYVGHTITVNPGSFLFGLIVDAKQYSRAVVSVSYSKPGIKITRKSKMKNQRTIIKCTELQGGITRGWKKYYDVYITVKCP